MATMALPFRCCSTGLAFCAANSSCPMLESSSSAFHHQIDWQTTTTTLQGAMPNSHTAMPNLHTAMVPPLVGSPGVSHDWGGFELPLWSSKAAADDDAVLLQAKSGDAAAAAAGARGTVLLLQQQQELEAFEGTSVALVASVAAAPLENGPAGASIAITAASPARSPPHGHGDEHPAAISHKRNQDRSSPDPKGSEAGGKRCRRESSSKAKHRRERSCSETSGESGGRAGKENQTKQQQEYIHVRARRGQATDSHSLAERVRREKMSERMKFLQDLVPGCRKVTGKAVMLDEIINYVQSLQRQVENWKMALLQSLSMKLAAVSPAQQSSHWTLESVLSNKETLHSQFSSNSAVAAAAAGPFGLTQQQQQPLPAAVVASPQAALPSAFGFDLRAFGNGLERVGCTSSLLRSPIAGLADLASLRPFNSSVSQVSSPASPSSYKFTGQEGELESVVQMGLHQQGQLGLVAGHLHCQLPVSRMKVEF